MARGYGTYPTNPPRLTIARNGDAMLCHQRHVAQPHQYHLMQDYQKGLAAGTRNTKTIGAVSCDDRQNGTRPRQNREPASYGRCLELIVKPEM